MGLFSPSPPLSGFESWGPPPDAPLLQSPIEEALYRAILLERLPVPVLQHQVHADDGGLITVPDFAYPFLRIAVFCDGWEFHRAKDQVEGDYNKRNWLQSRGWMVLVFTGTKIRKDPRKCARTLAIAIRERSKGMVFIGAARLPRC